MLRGRSRSAVVLILAAVIITVHLFLSDDSSIDDLSVAPQPLVTLLKSDPVLNNEHTVSSSSPLACDNCLLHAASNSRVFNTVPNATNSSSPYPTDDYQYLRRHVRKLNEELMIHNLDRFDLHASNDGTIVIVVQVHNRPEYLRQLIDSLQAARHIDEVLLIFSHDYYSDEINSIVTNITFCPVLQIFYPFSVQLYPDEFPGLDPRDCPRNVNRQQAEAMKCLNAGTPDRYGHYREPAFSQIKHHWFWKINHVFDHLAVTHYYNGLVLLLEEDHYVVPDFIPVLRQMYRLKSRVCPHCSIFTLGRYDKSPVYGDLSSKVEILSWMSAKHNMGMAFDRTVWQQIRACANAFCHFDDYNWDWSLQFAGVSCLPSKLKTMVVKSPRVFHVGECGGIHSKKRDKCEFPAARIASIDAMLSGQLPNLFPAALTVAGFPYGPDRLPRPNGGWGDTRDHDHCLLLMTNSSHS